MIAWFKHRPTRQAGGLVALGFIATVLIAALGESADWAVLVLLTLLAGVFQLAGAVLFNKTGKADPTLARASVRRLYRMAARAHAIRQVAEVAYELGSEADAKKEMGIVSAQLSFIEEGVVEAIEDWREFHKDALLDMKENTDAGE